MNASDLLAVFANHTWTESRFWMELTTSDYEYILKFCEINRNAIAERIEREKLSCPTPVVLFRIHNVILHKWKNDRDYRFLNLLCKFHTKGITKKFINLPDGRIFNDNLKLILQRELGHES